MTKPDASKPTPDPSTPNPEDLLAAALSVLNRQLPLLQTWTVDVATARGWVRLELTREQVIALSETILDATTPNWRSNLPYPVYTTQN